MNVRRGRLLVGAADELDQGSGRGRELGDRSVVRHPDVGAVRGDGVGAVELQPLMTFTRAPVEAESSVTESPREFATQTWLPSEAMAPGLLNP
jgi:hypothetical protein